MKYIWNVLIAIDQLANTILGGDPDETISISIGKIKGRRWWAKLVSKFLDKVDPGHSDKTQEPDEGNDRLVE